MSSPRRFGVIALMVSLMVALPLWAVTFVPVVEWNGTHFHVMNSSGVYQLQRVDDPVVDVPFSNPNSVVAWNDGTSYYAYVVDSFHDRVQFFTTDIAYYKDATSGGTGTLAWNSPAAAGGDFDATTIMLNNGGVVRGSEELVVGTDTYTRVGSLTGYTASDHVYTIVYEGAAGTGGVFTLPASSLTSSSVITVKYAYSATAATNLVGDIDYTTAIAAVNGTVSGDPFEINETIPNNTGHPSAFENIVSVAFNLNTDAGNDIADIYVLDAGDIGASVDPKLHTFQVEDDAAAVFEHVDTYDAPLSQPLDVAFAQSAANVLAVPAVTNWVGATQPPAAAPTATIMNNALYQNHDYSIDVVTWPPAGPSAEMQGAILQVTDNTTGNVIKYYTVPFTTVPAGAYNFDGLIPGVRVVITTDALMDFTAPGTGATFNTTGGTAASINDYIFICDSGNDRIKVLKGADNGEATTNGADPDFFGDDNTYQDCYGSVAAAVPNLTYVSAQRAMEATYTVYTKTSATATDSTQWTRVDNFAGSGPSDNHFMYDYDTQVLLFGDGNFGAIPTAGDYVFAYYKPVIDVMDFGTTGSGDDQFNAPGGVAVRYNTAQGWYDVYVSDTGNNRVVKLKYTAPTTGHPATMTWVTDWTATYTGGTALNSPTDLVV
ncbi:MAG TPA: hypothetical protein ENL08_01175, partial [Bacteroidetes bacterium]|nr:hypothetical protein [Bacteroidota bacterium]